MPESTELLELKTFGGLEIKDAAKGEVKAVIATVGVVDKNKDWILPTAIKSGARVVMSNYGHNAVWGDAPVGKGTLTMSGAEVVFNGQLFMDTQGGRECLGTLKGMGEDQEWSFGFRIVKASAPNEEQRAAGAMRCLEALDAFEVSPVTRGAGIGTRTLVAKEEKPSPEPVPPSPVSSKQSSGGAEPDRALEVRLARVRRQFLG